jgi:hypothetical protein
MIGMLTSLFGGGETASKSIDLISSSVRGIGGFIDEQEFTTEERVKAQMELARLNQELVKSTMHENSIRSITRRILAWSIMGSFLALILLSSIVYAIPFPSDTSDIRFGPEWAEHIMMVVDQLGNMALAVSIFYFGSALIGSKSKP